MRAAYALGLGVVLLLASCGYHVAGTTSALPPGIKVIAIPTFENRTNRYRLEQRMTQSVVREFITRSKYRIVPVEDSADAVLHGEITGIETTPVVFDTTASPNDSGANGTNARATTMLVSVRAKVWLEERETKKLLFHNDNFLFREPYEIATDPATFFDEQAPALDRLSRDFAARLVANVLENF